MYVRLTPATLAAVAASLLWAGCGGTSDAPPTCTPVPETCNGLDDDCDGSIDEDYATKGSTCSVGVGACEATGVTVCADGGVGVKCDAVAGTPTTEVCDGIDNDCDPLTPDGAADPLAGTACDGVDADLCEEGTRSCVAGQMICGDTTGDTPDVCNGLDDDCDPATPDGSGDPLAGAACDGPDGDLCKEGTWSCADGTLACSDATSTTVETCDGADDDCDGLVDADDPDLVQPPNTCLTQGACAGTAPTCTGAGGWRCVYTGPHVELDGSGAVRAIELKCDSYDGNCNGQVDESFPLLGAACDDGGVGVCRGSGRTVCGANQASTQCQIEVPGSTATAESCNGLDDDCDGATDEGLLGNLCPLQIGVCAGARQACGGSLGWQACTAASYGPNYQQGEASCDGLDNDCDGTTDEGLATACYEGPPATEGVGACTTGTATCGSGSWGSCVGQVLPADELCDGIDNDCSGMTDDPFILGGTVTLTDLDGSTGHYKGSTCGRGACSGGVVTCSADGLGLTCSTWTKVTAELCSDGYDNDCDGLTDAADPDCPWSRTIAIDGTPDFTANEQFATNTGGYTGWITWDATYLYVGYAGAEVASGSASKWLLVYLGATGTGTTTGLAYNTQVPALPFAATHHARVRLDFGYANLQRFNGSAWVDAGAPAPLVAHGGTYLELRIPRSDLGSPAALRIHVSMINEAAGSEWTWGGIPSTSFSDSWNPPYGHYLLFDLASRAAPASYSPL